MLSADENTKNSVMVKKAASLYADSKNLNNFRDAVDILDAASGVLLAAAPALENENPDAAKKAAHAAATGEAVVAAIQVAMQADIQVAMQADVDEQADMDEEE